MMHHVFTRHTINLLAVKIMLPPPFTVNTMALSGLVKGWHHGGSAKLIEIDHHWWTLIYIGQSWSINVNWLLEVSINHRLTLINHDPPAMLTVSVFNMFFIILVVKVLEMPPLKLQFTMLLHHSYQVPSRTVFCQWLPTMIDHAWHWI